MKTTALDQVILYLAPRLAMQRAYYRTQAQRFYEAGADSIYHRKPKNQGSGDQAMDKARTRIRDWARHLDENYDLAIGILDELVNKIVGTGIQVEPNVLKPDGSPDEATNAAIAKIKTRWEKHPEVTGQMHFNKLQRITCRTWLRDGEALAQLVVGRIPGRLFY